MNSEKKMGQASPDVVKELIKEQITELMKRARERGVSLHLGDFDWACDTIRDEIYGDAPSLDPKEAAGVRPLAIYFEALKTRSFANMSNLAAKLLHLQDKNWVLDDNRFGVCSECYGLGRIVFMKQEAWLACDQDKVKWCPGTDVPPEWDELTDGQREENARLLLEYKEVSPIYILTYLGKDAAQISEYEGPRSDNVPF